MRYEIVLPLPVLDAPNISLSANAWGKTQRYISVILINFRYFNAFYVFNEIGRSSKSILNFYLNSSFE